MQCANQNCVKSYDKSFLPMLILDKHSSFVEGCLLTNNALVAFELNHYISKKRQGKNGITGYNIDISKAYDRLEWHFLEAMMKNLDLILYG